MDADGQGKLVVALRALTHHPRPDRLEVPCPSPRPGHPRPSPPPRHRAETHASAEPQPGRRQLAKRRSELQAARNTLEQGTPTTARPDCGISTNLVAPGQTSAESRWRISPACPCSFASRRAAWQSCWTPFTSPPSRSPPERRSASRRPRAGSRSRPASGALGGRRPSPARGRQDRPTSTRSPRAARAARAPQATAGASPRSVLATAETNRKPQPGQLFGYLPGPFQTPLVN